MDWIRVRLLVRTFEQIQISDADAGHKKEKNCNVGEEGKFGYFVCEELSEAVSKGNAWGRGRY